MKMQNRIDNISEHVIRNYMLKHDLTTEQLKKHGKRNIFRTPFMQEFKYKDDLVFKISVIYKCDKPEIIIDTSYL